MAIADPPRISSSYPGFSFDTIGWLSTALQASTAVCARRAASRMYHHRLVIDQRGIFRFSSIRVCTFIVIIRLRPRTGRGLYISKQPKFTNTTQRLRVYLISSLRVYYFYLPAYFYSRLFFYVGGETGAEPFFLTGYIVLYYWYYTTYYLGFLYLYFFGVTMKIPH